MRPALRRAVAAAATTALAGGAVLLTATGAAAHVTVSPSSTDAGSYTVLTFAFGHGCDGLPTTELRVQMPEEIIAAAPTMHSGWHIVKMFENLDEPIDDGHGGEYTTRVSEVVFHAEQPIEDGFRDAVSIQVRLPDDAAGETFYFPVRQICAGGSAESAWIQRPEEGQDPHDLPEPAPAFTVTDAGSAGDDDAAAAAGEVTAAGASGDATAAGASADVVSWAALAAGVGGLVLGGLAFAGSRRRAGNES